jgi:hypothetical protein
MEQKSLRALVIEKLADGRLPHDSTPRFWGGPGNNETCVACNLVIGRDQFVMEGDGDGMPPIQFHITCFHFWDEERTKPM